MRVFRCPSRKTTSYKRWTAAHKHLETQKGVCALGDSLTPPFIWFVMLCSRFQVRNRLFLRCSTRLKYRCREIQRLRYLWRRAQAAAAQSDVNCDSVWWGERMIEELVVEERSRNSPCQIQRCERKRKWSWRGCPHEKRECVLMKELSFSSISKTPQIFRFNKKYEILELKLTSWNVLFCLTEIQIY